MVLVLHAAILVSYACLLVPLSVHLAALGTCAGGLYAGDKYDGVGCRIAPL